MRDRAAFEYVTIGPFRVLHESLLQYISRNGLMLGDGQEIQPVTIVIGAVIALPAGVN